MAEIIGKMMVKVGGVVAPISPYAMARFSHHSFNMASGYIDDRGALLARSYFFCLSIEVGLKSAILSVDCNSASKKHIKSLGHNLLKVYQSFEDKMSVNLFCDSHISTLRGINPFFYLRVWNTLLMMFWRLRRVHFRIFHQLKIYRRWLYV